MFTCSTLHKFTPRSLYSLSRASTLCRGETAMMRGLLLFALICALGCSEDTSSTSSSGESSDSGSMTVRDAEPATITDARPEMARDVGPMIDPDASVERTTQGLNSLYMGHSYFRRQAEAMVDFAETAGIEGHRSTSFFRGGYNGSAFAIWEDSESQATIQGYLDAGDVEMFGMTIFVDPEADVNDGAHIDNQTQGIKSWIEYAIAQNPDTIFFVALPWLGRPLQYVGETGDPQTSGHEEYREVILQSEVGIRALIDELRDTFVDSEIFLLAYGQGSVELRTLYNQGNLPDVDTLVSGDGLLGIHRDTHGHAEQMLTDLNTLIWLESIYDYNVLNFEEEFPYETDIKEIAHDVAKRQHADYIRQFD